MTHMLESLIRIEPQGMTNVTLLQIGKEDGSWAH